MNSDRVPGAKNTLRLTFFKGVGWTIGAYGASQLLKIVSSVVLARLLSPDIFGIMVIVYSLRTGIDLVSDVGISQSIVQNANADNPEFYNTAWTLQLLRGLVLWVIFLIAAEPVAHIYQMPFLSIILMVSASYFVFFGFSSVSIYMLQRRLQVTKLNLFMFGLEFVSVIATIALAYFNPTVWALVFGTLAFVVARMFGSYFLLPHIRQRFRFEKNYAGQIFRFGIWITISSAVYYLSLNVDRLYLGATISLALLGIYGIARNISDIMVNLANRVCNYVVFPFAALVSDRPRDELRDRLRPLRLKSLLFVAVCLSLFAATADIPITILYDARYHTAAQMLPIMTVGVWFSIITNINEATLLGFGKPLYGATGNITKLAWLAFALPIFFPKYGILEVIVIVSLSDLSKYIPILIGQTRMRFSFAAQDLLLTIMMLGLTGLWVWARWALGFGAAFSGLSLDSN